MQLLSYEMLENLIQKLKKSNRILKQNTSESRKIKEREREIPRRKEGRF
jgi:hypothetical protein